MRNFKKAKESKYEVKTNLPLSRRGDPFVVDGVSINPNDIEIGDNIIQPFELGFWPPMGVPGFTDQLLPEHSSSLVIQAVPQQTTETLKQLGKSIRLQNSSYRESKKKGVGDPELERRIQDAENLREAVNRGATKFFRVSVSLLTYTQDVERSKLPSVKAEVKRKAREKSAEMISPDWEQADTYRGGMPGGRPLFAMRLLETNSLASLFPFTNLDHFEEGGIPLGINQRTKNPFSINRWKHKNQHWYVSADSGAGKSLFIKEYSPQEHILGRPLIYLDPSPSEEYRTIVNQLDGNYMTLGAGVDVKINPFVIPPDPRQLRKKKDPTQAKGRPLALRISILKPIIKTFLGISTNDAVAEARIEKCLISVYGHCGFTKDNWASVYHSEEDELYGIKWVPNHKWPILSDLHKEFINKGFSEFAEALEPYIEGGTSNMFDGQTTINVNNPVVGFGINHLVSVPGPFARAAYAIVMDYCITLFGAYRNIKEKSLFIDEAHNLFNDPVMSMWVVREYREARKAHVGVTAISQSAMDALHENTRPIWNNSSAKFFLSQPAVDLREAALNVGIDPQLLVPAANFPVGHILCLLEDGQVFHFKSFFPPELEAAVKTDDDAEED
ncbi:VirB4 family type IV secretion system protein [Desulfosporosinus acidiphilus]|uniref:VirB4 family type IV secretion system protein n=1 Tax=Desulfosporosinus acidiphilus TaxID=885581 RepID=UPI0011D193F1|nr:hypothetical protein [Desulfosporosinus acidiphilus]